MRLLYLSPYPPARDGIGDYTAGLVAAMRALGHEVRVITLRASAAPLDGAGTVLPRSPRGIHALLREIDDYDPDVVHLQFAIAAYGSRIPSLLRLLRGLGTHRAPVVATLHEVTRDTDTLGAPGRALYRRVAALADRVVVHTEAALETLTGHVGAGAPAMVVPHARAELPPAAATGRELRERHGLGDARVLLAFGFIHVDKGLDDLVRALHLLEREHGIADVRLVVAGAIRARQLPFKGFEARDRVHLRRVRSLIRRSGLARRVAFTGYVPAGEMRPWFELAEAAVLPYTRIEQSGVSSLAAAAGTPALASRVGGLTEISGDRWSYPPRRPDLLAAALADFLSASRPAGDLPTPGPGGPDFDEIAARTVALYLEGVATPDPAEQEREVAHA